MSKQMKRFFCYCIFILCLLAFTCDHYDGRLMIVNNSSLIIVTHFSGDSIIKDLDNEFIGSYLAKRLSIGDTLKRIIPGRNAWQNMVKNSPNGKLNVFVVPYDTLRKYRDWDSIREKGLYERFGYTLEELKRSKWLVEYPPASPMTDE